MASPSDVRTMNESNRTETGADLPASAGWRSDAWRRAFLLRLLVSCEIAVGVFLILRYAPRFHGDWWVLLALGVLNVVAERMPISIYGESYISVGFVFTMANIVLFGPLGVVIVAPLEGLTGRLGRAPWDYIRARNAGRFTLVYWAAAEAYSLFAPVGPNTLDLTLVAGGVAATATAFVLFSAFNIVSLWLRKGVSFGETWENRKWLAPQYVALGFVGLALATAYVGLGIAAIVAFITPVVMMRVTMKQYVDKTADNVELLKAQNAALGAANVEIRKVSEELRFTYDSTLEALVSALDARDQETHGHSIRVARYMLTIAEALGVKPGSQEWVDMQRGALLHDVGKIGVRDAILWKPGKLSPEEWVEMRRHPEIGFNMLREVKFLRGAAEIVLAHHERWDGQGYPRGLTAEEVPLGSRIFMVVDTFDSMTSDRPYRRALSSKVALEEIIRCGGSQFDPLVVQAFLHIYEAWALERDRLHGAEVKRAA